LKLLLRLRLERLLKLLLWLRLERLLKLLLLLRTGSLLRLRLDQLCPRAGGSGKPRSETRLPRVDWINIFLAKITNVERKMTV
jgi:hypothetical protein